LLHASLLSVHLNGCWHRMAGCLVCDWWFSQENVRETRFDVKIYSNIATSKLSVYCLAGWASHVIFHIVCLPFECALILLHCSAYM
jgi:hypothetical protein